MEIDPADLKLVDKMGVELDRRDKPRKELRKYASGDHPVPAHVTHAELETEYRVLMEQAITNWPELIVKAVSQRLAVSSFYFAEQDLGREAWGHWQRNRMDQRSRQIHDAALIDGRAFVIVWNDENGKPTAYIDDSSTTVVMYDASGNRVAALRRWKEGERWYATLYKPGEIVKLIGPEKSATCPKGEEWEARTVEGEEWPLTSKLPIVPVVEYALNGSIAAGEFGSAAGEFERELPIIDRINTTIFSGLLAQTYSAFPVRALIGDKIKYEQKKDADGEPVTDDDGKPVMEPVAPVKLAVNRLIQIENKDGKLVQLPEAQLDNYIKFAETHIRHLAAITQTPAHYLLGEMVNLSADAIRAAEAGLISKTKGHQIDLGESHEEVARLFLLVDDPEREIPDDIETRWKDAESRSLAERADAAVKLAAINMPWQLIGEMVLGLSEQEIARAQANVGADALGKLIATGGTEAEPVTPA